MPNSQNTSATSGGSIRARTAFRISMAILIASGCGLLIGVGIFVALFNQADATGNGDDNPLALTVMICSLIAGAVSLGACAVIDTRRNRTANLEN